MKYLWNKINQLNVTAITKRNLFIILSMIVDGLLGGLVWLGFGQFFLPKMEWLVCFIGYPVVFIGYFGGIFYTLIHEYK